MRNLLAIRALLRAEDVLGGADELAKYLHVPRPTLDAWTRGAEDIPMAIFFRVVDIILDDEVQRLKRRPPPPD
ncbi:MAG: hypothetical protein ACT4P4_04145 [Betaproteobacteria bacterium]